MELQDAFVGGAGVLLFYLLAGILYRLYVCPLARIPGPKVAAITGFYELYYDIFQGARFPWKLQELHDTYGKTKELRFL